MSQQTIIIKGEQFTEEQIIAHINDTKMSHEQRLLLIVNLIKQETVSTCNYNDLIIDFVEQQGKNPDLPSNLKPAYELDLKILKGVNKIINSLKNHPTAVDIILNQNNVNQK